MMKSIRFHLYGMKMAFFSSAAYRMDFFTGLLVMLAGTLLSPLLIIIIYRNGATLGDYSIYQIFLMQGIYLIVTGLGSILFFNIVYDTTFRVREGTLDILLLKPQSLLSNLIATNYSNGGIADILGGSLLFVYALCHLPAATTGQYVFFIIAIFFALAVLFAFSVILAALGIVWVGNSRLFDIYNSVSKFASYPMTIFSKPLQAILSFFIPVAMLGFIPASILSGPPDPAIYVTAASCVVFVAISLLFWRIMIKRYTSTGG